MDSKSPTQPPLPDLAAFFHGRVGQRAALRQQNTLLGFLAGFMAMLAGTGLWVTIAHAAHANCAIVAVGVGFLIGAAVQFFGRGVVRLFSAVAALFAAAACGFGTLCIACADLAASHTDGFWSTFASLQPGSAGALFRARLGAVDLVCFGLAIALAWLLARRRSAFRRDA